MLHEFIGIHRDEIIARCRAKVTLRSIPPPSDAEINHGVPLFLDQLVAALHSGDARGAIEASARQHGLDLLGQGFTVSQVVHDYGDVCQTITQLAVENHVSISTDDFKTLNWCLDEAIASAVTVHSGESQSRATQKQQEAASRSQERVGFLVHELRNLVSTAIVAFEVLKVGQVGVSGATGSVLQRSLLGVREIIARSLDEVRATNGTANRRRMAVAPFIAGIAPAARLAADARGITLRVMPVEEDAAVDADPQILAAVVGNLLQNATKFTHEHTTVILRVRANLDRILIEVEDECGGLPEAGEAKEFAPASFEQRNSNRTGLGIGLAFSRWGAEVNAGRLYARNLPGKGCIFTVDLPRAANSSHA